MQTAVSNASGRPVTNLPTAARRLGVELVRCAALSLAFRQMRLVGADRALRPQLPELWRKGAVVASIGCVVGRETRAARSGEARVPGLLHNGGRLDLLVQAESLSSVVAEAGT